MLQVHLLFIKRQVVDLFRTCAPTGDYGSNLALYVAHIRGPMGSLEIRRVGFLTIYSSNLAASRKFYVDLLEFPLTREVSNEFFQIDIAGVPICVDLNEGEPRQNNIGLEVDDLGATVAVLRNKPP